MKELYIPCSCQGLPVGSIVMLERFEDTKWVLENGWYAYEGQRYNGWYFSSIPDFEVMPVQEADLENLTIISVYGDSCNCSCSSDTLQSVVKYQENTSYTKGQILWLSVGTLYQVVESFTSSSSEDTAKENLQKDIDSGYLVGISSSTVAGVPMLFALNFKEIFGTDALTKEQADAYLEALVPAIEPVSGTSFINTDEEAETYAMLYAYCTEIVDEQETLTFLQISNRGEKGDTGETGADGKSAYDVAVENGFEGTESEWLSSLKGEKGDVGEQGPQGVPGESGEKGEIGETGQDGKSAYEIAVENGYTGTESEWLASLKGEKGEQGIQGEKGETGATGEAGANGKDGADGVSVTSAAVTDGELMITLSSGDTIDAGYVKGSDGENGTNGTDGENGKDGTDGISVTGASVNDSGNLILTLSSGSTIDAGIVKGADGTSITILGDLTSTEELPSSAQTLGDCYLIGGELWVYTGSTESGAVNGFTNAGSIKGPSGRGITTATIDETGMLVITYSDGTSETVGTVKGERGDTGETGATGADGQNGKSAYEIAVENGFSGTETEWLASLKGEKGDIGETGTQGEQGEKGDTGDTGAAGADGKSAYEIAVENGYTGTESEWLASLKGEKGDTGEAGIAGEQGEKGVDGASAYDIWIAAGNTGTETDFLTSLKGEKGEVGETGNGIASVEKTSTTDNVDTYTITYTNGTTSDFTVTNGVTPDLTDLEARVSELETTVGDISTVLSTIVEVNA